MIPHRLLRAPALAAAALALAAAPGAAQLLPGAAPYADCRVADPRPLPAVAELADTAGLRPVLLPAAHDRRGAFTVFELDWDTAGAPFSVRAAATSLPWAEADAAARLLASRLRPRPVARGAEDGPAVSQTLLLRVDAGAPPRLRVSGPELCAPVLLNGESIRRVLATDLADRAEPDWPGGTRELVLLVRVDTAGTVAEARLARGTGVAAADSFVLGLGRRMRFRPFLVNRRAASVWMTFPFAVELEARRRPSNDR